MSDIDDGTSNSDLEDEYPRSEQADRRWVADADLQQERLREQVDIILNSLPGSVAHTGASDDLGDMQYLYRGGTILIRDADLPRVHDILGGNGLAQDQAQDSLTGPGPAMLNGLTSYLVPDGDTQGALETIDRTLGAGVATPDHVLYVTAPKPSNAGCCPATEPRTTTRTTPDPPINTDKATSGKGVLVCVIDTGLVEDLTHSSAHPWLDGVTGDPETVNPAALHPYVGHGTFVAGVVRCMAPEAEVHIEGFLPAGGAVYESDIIRELGAALTYAPDIISLSAGGWTRNNLPLLGFEVFWETRLRHYKGTAFVAAAGNDGNRGPFWPAGFPWALSVGALEKDGTRADYSNFGSWVDVYARGSDIINAFPNGSYTYTEPPRKGQTVNFANGLANWSGTSFAAPIVSGLIAARMSRTGESAYDAAQALRRIAVADATAGVGAILALGAASR